MYFDTHAHYDDEQFDSDRSHLLSSMPENGVEIILNPGCDLKTSEKAVSFAETYPFVYAAVGLHPENITDSDVENLAIIGELEKLASNPKVKAIGEIGLDYHYTTDNKELQKSALRAQMELAGRLRLPVIIHERDACRDTLELLSDYKPVKGVFHCFSGSWETAQTILSWGWNISFTGVITFKNARRALEVIEKIPHDRIMIETDSPYLAPVPNRGKRNSSLYLPYIAETVGNVWGISGEEVGEITLQNGKRFFGIE